MSYIMTKLINIHILNFKLNSFLNVKVFQPMRRGTAGLLTFWTLTPKWTSSVWRPSNCWCSWRPTLCTRPVRKGMMSLCLFGCCLPGTLQRTQSLYSRTTSTLWEIQGDWSRWVHRMSWLSFQTGLKKSKPCSVNISCLKSVHFVLFDDFLPLMPVCSSNWRQFE